MCDIVSFLKFVLLCCPEGTYVKEGDRMISFKRERDSRCPPLIMQSEEVSVESVLLIFAIIGMIGLLLMYYMYKVYKAFGRQR